MSWYHFITRGHFEKSDTEVFFCSCRFKLSEGLNEKNLPVRHLKQNTLTPEY